MATRFAALAAALAAGLLTLSAAASAAPPLRANVRALPVATVGTDWRAVVTVTRAGRRVAGLRVTLRVTRGRTAFAARTRARARGVYTARIRFSSAGTYGWAARAASRTLARGTVRVRPAGTATGPHPTPMPVPDPVADPRFREWSVVSAGGQVHPHDVWPVGDGTVWYTAQFKGALGRLNAATGAAREIPLGGGTGPHGVIAGPDGDAWVTAQTSNELIRVDSVTEAITRYAVPGPATGPHTATFDGAGNTWFTGSAGYIGRIDATTGAVAAWPVPRGAGPYGMTRTPAGEVYFVSLRTDGYLAKVNTATGAVTVIDSPAGAGPRRVWSDSRGNLWVTEFFAGRLARYEPATGAWTHWNMPGPGSAPYAVWVDAADKVWITDHGTNTLVRFDPLTQLFQSFVLPRGALVRQIVGDAGGIWGAASGRDSILLFRSG